MSFEEQLKNFVSKVVKIKGMISTEEATKTSIIMPFFQILGYDIFNPNEFTPEYIADVGIKKGEKVDYAIILDDEVSILIEAKAISEKLEKHDSQLFRYFGTSRAKFAILTNGLIYKFYTDLEKANVMDTSPFLEINLEKLKDSDIQELKKFQRENFNIDHILSAAADLKYLSQIKKVLEEEFDEPTDEFVKLILNKDIYNGQKNQSVLDKYRPLIKKSLSYYVNELIYEILQNAMKKNNDIEEQVSVEETNGIVTTMEEMEAFYTIKSILAEYCDANKISYKDNCNYFAVLYDNKVTKWLCRIYLKENVKFIVIPDAYKNEIRINIQKVNDIYKHKKELLDRLSTFSDIPITLQ
ncbi:MAG: type I restriction enzyme HsdR N-terminal domain-containing protein [Bacilli bacterium]